MDMVEKNILDICKDFIKLADKLYKNGQITYEQYNEMVKLKLEYVNKVT